MFAQMQGRLIRTGLPGGVYMNAAEGGMNGYQALTDPNMTDAQRYFALLDAELSIGGAGVRAFSSLRSIEQGMTLNTTLADAKVNVSYRPGGLMSLGNDGQITVIGSGRDVANIAKNNSRGLYNIFTPSAPVGKMTQQALDADNLLWAQAAASRSLAGRGTVQLVTNPAIHMQAMQSRFGTANASALFRVELPFFQQQSVNVVPAYVTSPVR